jgi:hypothetical protein
LANHDTLIYTPSTGLGQYTCHADGSVSVGTYNLPALRFEGEVVRTFDNGERLTAFYENGQPCGAFRCEYPSGAVFTCNYITISPGAASMCGMGTTQFPNGDAFMIKYKDGRMGGTGYYYSGLEVHKFGTLDGRRHGDYTVTTCGGRGSIAHTKFNQDVQTEPWNVSGALTAVLLATQTPKPIRIELCQSAQMRQ